MKKYTKPTVKVVNLKSSNDIAASFDNLRRTILKSYLYSGGTKEYAVSVYSNTISSNGEEVIPTVEG